MSNKEEIEDSFDLIRDRMSDTTRQGKYRIDRIIEDSEDKLNELKKKSQSITDDILKESSDKIEDVKRTVRKELKKRR